MNGKEEQENKKVIEGYDYLGNSASATDCTGLIPSAPRSEAERESYEAVYHYQPRVVSRKSQEEDTKQKKRAGKSGYAQKKEQPAKGEA